MSITSPTNPNLPVLAVGLLASGHIDRREVIAPRTHPTAFRRKAPDSAGAGSRRDGHRGPGTVTSAPVTSGGEAAT